ncbi:hypothetical protein Bca52824_026275 [Brassica carinata]|uniref:Uncharacterized protein n=1 Tax=Brassica carinata TaxID=52824 RepID=A0A8X7V8Y9_BRACI|nr:hypothetical protein Bca52824_026275 [Brassica carinata]
MWSSLLSYHFSILSSEEVKFSAAYDDNATQDHVKCNVVYMSYRYIFQHLMLPTNPPLQKRLNNEAPVPNPHPPPQHPRPTSQHCRQIPGPIRFHGERKRRRRQRNEVRKKVRSQGRVWWALEASKGADWYLQPDILLIGAGGITLKTSLKIYALSSAITISPRLRPKVWFSLPGAEKKKSTVPESYYSDLTEAVDGMSRLLRGRLIIFGVN